MRRSDASEVGKQIVSRLVIASHIVPAPDQELPAGGLASAFVSALQKRKGIWFGWSGDIVTGGVGPTRIQQHGDVTYATIDLNRRDYRGYFDGYANQTLWPLLHYRVDLTAFDREPFAGYMAVNTLFAERLAPLLEEGDLVWVHDYHLIPLGEELRRAGQLGAKLGFFLHTPLPPTEILTTLFNHRRLARALLHYDLIGFQTDQDLHSFRDYVVRELRDGRTDRDGRVSAYGHSPKAGAFPMGIEPQSFQETALAPAAKQYYGRICSSLSGRSLILSVDRLDYSKGLPQRLAAVEQLLEDYPAHCNEFSFLQVASPSRPDVPEYINIRTEIEEAVGRINGRFADTEWAPIRYLRTTFSQPQLCGLYRAARVGLVTPLRDGMNLVAKEFVAAQDPADPGVLVLSRFAGAAQQMKEAIIVNPYDKWEVAAALHKALTMPQDERIERWTGLMQNLSKESLTAWREHFLSELRNTPALPAF